MKLTEKNKQLLIAGVILGVLVGFMIGYYYVIFAKPTIAANQKRIVTLDEEISKNRRELERIQALLNNPEELNRMKQIVERAQMRLPSRNDPYEFLQLLQENLTKTDVSFTRVDPVTPIQRNLYEEMPFTVEGYARYHAFGQFLNLIECNPDRFMRVNSFRLDNQEDRPSQHPMQVVVSTFAFTGS